MTDLKTELEAALGNRAAFFAVARQFDQLSMADAKTLALAFTGRRVGSRTAARKAIWARQTAVLVQIAKRQATAGRSAG
jgi:hypothetical protein